MVYHRRLNKLDGGSYFLAYQFINDLCGGLAGRHRFGQEVVCRELVQPHEAQFPLGEPIIAVGAELGNGAGQFLVQSIVFFVGHVSIACHCFLLLPELRDYTVSAAHGVKDLYRIIADGVIEHFNRITCPVETNESIFVIVAFQWACMDFSPVGVPNVRLGRTVLERGRHAYNLKLHILSLPQKRRRGKQSERIREALFKFMEGLIAVNAGEALIYRVDHEVHCFKRQCAKEDIVGFGHQ